MVLKRFQLRNVEGQSSPRSIYPYVEHISILIFREQNSKNLDSVARIRERKGGIDNWDVKGSEKAGRSMALYQNCITDNTFHAALQAWIHLDEIISMKPVN